MLTWLGKDEKCEFEPTLYVRIYILIRVIRANVVSKNFFNTEFDSHLNGNSSSFKSSQFPEQLAKNKYLVWNERMYSWHVHYECFVNFD